VAEEVKELQKGITDILVAIGKIETEIKQLASMSVKLETTEKNVIQQEQAIKSAHKRLDDLKKEVDEFVAKYNADTRDSKEDRKWLWGLLIGSLAFVWKVLETAFNAN
jgi:tetrahydromethanopterin S-methyltransferase subunit G